MFHHGSIIWDSPSIEVFGMKLEIVQKHFANTTITIGTLHFALSPSNVHRVFCLQWLLIERVSSTLVNGLCRLFSRVLFQNNNMF